MKLPSINFNEGGRLLSFAFNLSNVFFAVAVVVPYIWWDEKYMNPERLSYGHGWHIKYKLFSYCLYKKNI